MKTIQKLLLVCPVLFYLQASSQQRIPLSPFENLKIEGKLDVTLVQDTACFAELENDLSTGNSGMFENKGNTLNIRSGKSNNKKGSITLHTTGVNAVQMSGSGDLISRNVIKGKKLSIVSSGSSDIKLKLDVEKVYLEVSGAGDVMLEGKAIALDAKLSGASDLHASKLETDSTLVDISGAGDAHVWTNKALRGSISGAGSIHYKGDAREINVEKTGVGTVSKVSGIADAEIEKNGDTTRLKIGKKNIMIIDEVITAREEADEKREREEDDENSLRNLWSGLEFGVNGYATAGRSIGMPRENGFLDINYGRSFVINFNPMVKYIPLVKNHVGIFTGLGLECNRYYFADRVRLESAPDTVTATLTGLRYRTNVLRMTYLSIPFMMQFQAGRNPDKATAIAFGLIGSWKPGSARLRQVYSFEERTYKTTTKTNYYINPFKVSMAARLAFRNLEFFASYSLTPLFAKDKTIELYPFTLGLRLISF